MKAIGKFISRFRSEQAKAEGQTPVSRHETFHVRRATPRFGHTIAVAWDSTHIRMATVRHLGFKTKLIDFARESVGIEISASEQFGDYVADRIAQYVNRQPRVIRQLTLVVNDRETVFRCFLMPDLRGKDLCSAVRFEAGKQLPFPAERCHYGFTHLSKIESHESTRHRIALHAVTAIHVKARLEPLLKQSSPAIAIHHAPEATGLLLAALPEYDSNRVYTLLELTPQRSIVSVYRGTSLVFSNTGNAATESISDAGLHPSRIGLFVDAVIADLETSQDYYSGLTATDLSELVYVHGDLPHRDELLDVMRARQSFHFELFPTEKLKAGINDVSNEAALACLPVVGSAMDRSQLVNLLPARLQETNRRRRLVDYSRAAAVLVALGLGLYSLMLYQQADTARQELTTVRHDLNALQLSEANRTYHIIKRQIAADQAFLDLAKEKPSVMGLALKELSRITDRKIRLNAVQYQPSEGIQTIDLSGVVTSTDTPPEITLAEFVESLRSSPFFDKIEVTRHSKKTADGVFELHFTLQLVGVMS